MEGKVVSYRRGFKTQQKYQMIVKVSGVDTKEKAHKIVGKTASWKSTAGKEIKGQVTNVHGNSGALRVQFEKGLPGQSVGTKVELN